ncbi:MAG: peptide deformylase [Candidatus Omnitrophica bacterium]|nr:peptide deformylase [Candidatus Omnitrophota bacterium]
MSEIGLKIRVLGDPVLRGKAKKVKEILESHRSLLSKMARIMYDSEGIGLAAPQVGVEECLIVIDAGNGLYKLINPRIVSCEGTQSFEEGCLSVPGVTVKVKRSKRILVEALDENGKPLKLEVQNLLACVFQHEIDHLEGKLIVDYIPFFKKILLKKKITPSSRKTRMENPKE